jgi:hypothetical protein
MQLQLNKSFFNLQNYNLQFIKQMAMRLKINQ